MRKLMMQSLMMGALLINAFTLVTNDTKKETHGTQRILVAAAAQIQAAPRALCTEQRGASGVFSDCTTNAPSDCGTSNPSSCGTTVPSDGGVNASFGRRPGVLNQIPSRGTLNEFFDEHGNPINYPGTPGAPVSSPFKTSQASVVGGRCQASPRRPA